jgi:Flp pilus assembly protein CpaB
MGAQAGAQGPAGTFPVPRRRLVSRLSAGHMVMIVAGLLGLVLTVVAIRAADDSHKVAVAATDIESGRPLTEADVRWVDVRLPPELADRAVRPDDVDSLDGAVAASAIPAGELLSEADLRPIAAEGGRRAMSIPVDPSRAVNGDLEPGDRVDVLVARGGQVTVVVADAEVLDVMDQGSGGLGAVAADFAITLAVDVRESQLLTAAIADGEFVVTRSTGAESAAQAPPLVVTGAVVP